MGTIKGAPDGPWEAVPYRGRSSIGTGSAPSQGACPVTPQPLPGDLMLDVVFIGVTVLVFVVLAVVARGVERL
ncbi:hypothetical protein [Peterkaempfera bronchialis]|uniref:hypothetical protein n=1 Tax=Peterkaempfera bronchialis TaxID=2126346 RepID=UPI0013B3596F|nr:hypothetical protein [Peterkaempfera bronchialis]